MSFALDRLPEATRQIRARRRDSLIATLRDAFANPPADVVEVRLFGSWARGDFDGRSDVDLLIVTRGETDAVDPPRIPGLDRMDVVLISSEKLARYLGAGHGFYTKAMADGVLLYGAAPVQAPGATTKQAMP